MAKQHAFAWSPVRALMADAGAEIVAKDAVEVLLDFLEDRATKLTSMALKFTRHANRKKVTAGDMELAINYL